MSSRSPSPSSRCSSRPSSTQRSRKCYTNSHTFMKKRPSSIRRPESSTDDDIAMTMLDAKSAVDFLKREMHRFLKFSVQSRLAPLIASKNELVLDFRQALDKDASNFQSRVDDIFDIYIESSIRRVDAAAASISAKTTKSSAAADKDNDETSVLLPTTAEEKTSPAETSSVESSRNARLRQDVKKKAQAADTLLKKKEIKLSRWTCPPDLLQMDTDSNNCRTKYVDVVNGVIINNAADSDEIGEEKYHVLEDQLYSAKTMAQSLQKELHSSEKARLHLSETMNTMRTHFLKELDHARSYLDQFKAWIPHEHVLHAEQNMSIRDAEDVVIGDLSTLLDDATAVLVRQREDQLQKKHAGEMLRAHSLIKSLESEAHEHRIALLNQDSNATRKLETLSQRTLAAEREFVEYKQYQDEQEAAAKLKAQQEAPAMKNGQGGDTNTATGTVGASTFTQHRPFVVNEENEELARLERRLSIAEFDRNEVLRILGAQMEEIEDLRITKSSLVESLEQMESKLADTETSLERQKKMAQPGHFESVISALQDAVTNSEATIANLQEELNESQQANEGLQDTVLVLGETVNELENSIQESHQKEQGLLQQVTASLSAEQEKDSGEDQPSVTADGNDAFENTYQKSILGYVDGVGNGSCSDVLAASPTTAVSDRNLSKTQSLMATSLSKMSILENSISAHLTQLDAARNLVSQKLGDRQGAEGIEEAESGNDDQEEECERYSMHDIPDDSEDESVQEKIEEHPDDENEEEAQDTFACDSINNNTDSLTPHSFTNTADRTRRMSVLPSSIQSRMTVFVKSRLTTARTSNDQNGSVSNQIYALSALRTLFSCLGQALPDKPDLLDAIPGIDSILTSFSRDPHQAGRSISANLGMLVVQVFESILVPAAKRRRKKAQRQKLKELTAKRQSMKNSSSLTLEHLRDAADRVEKNAARSEEQLNSESDEDEFTEANSKPFNSNDGDDYDMMQATTKSSKTPGTRFTLFDVAAGGRGADSDNDSDDDLVIEVTDLRDLTKSQADQIDQFKEMIDSDMARIQFLESAAAEKTEKWEAKLQEEQKKNLDKIRILSEEYENIESNHAGEIRAIEHDLNLQKSLLETSHRKIERLEWEADERELKISQLGAEVDRQKQAFLDLLETSKDSIDSSTTIAANEETLKILQERFADSQNTLANLHEELVNVVEETTALEDLFLPSQSVRLGLDRQTQARERINTRLKTLGANFDFDDVVQTVVNGNGNNGRKVSATGRRNFTNTRLSINSVNSNLQVPRNRSRSRDYDDDDDDDDDDGGSSISGRSSVACLSDVDEGANQTADGDLHLTGEMKSGRKTGKSLRSRRITTRISLNGIDVGDNDNIDAFDDDQEGLSDLEPEAVLDKVAKKAISSWRAVDLLRARFAADGDDDESSHQSSNTGSDVKISNIPNIYPDLRRINSNDSGGDALTRNFGFSDCVRASLMSQRRHSLDGLEEFGRRRTSTVQKLGVYYKNCECQTDIGELAPCFGYTEQECQTPKWWAVLDRANNKKISSEQNEPLRHSCTMGDLDSKAAHDDTEIGEQAIHMSPSPKGDSAHHQDGRNSNRERCESAVSTVDSQCQTDWDLVISEDSIRVLNRLLSNPVFVDQMMKLTNNSMSSATKTSQNNDLSPNLQFNRAPPPFQVQGSFGQRQQQRQGSIGALQLLSGASPSPRGSTMSMNRLSVSSAFNRNSFTGGTLSAASITGRNSLNFGLSRKNSLTGRNHSPILYSSMDVDSAMVFKNLATLLTSAYGILSNNKSDTEFGEKSADAETQTNEAMPSDSSGTKVIMIKRQYSRDSNIHRDRMMSAASSSYRRSTLGKKRSLKLDKSLSKSGSRLISVGGNNSSALNRFRNAVNRARTGKNQTGKDGKQHRLSNRKMSARASRKMSARRESRASVRCSIVRESMLSPRLDPMCKISSGSVAAVTMNPSQESRGSFVRQSLTLFDSFNNGPHEGPKKRFSTKAEIRSQVILRQQLGRRRSNSVPDVVSSTWSGDQIFRIGDQQPFYEPVDVHDNGIVGDNQTQPTQHSSSQHGSDNQEIQSDDSSSSASGELTLEPLPGPLLSSSSILNPTIAS